MKGRHVTAVVVVVSLVSLSPAIAASSAAGTDSHPLAATDVERTAEAIPPIEMAQEAPPDPETDPIGWEAGYWANESLSIDQSDGLSGSERDAFLARSMARVESIRGLEFTEPVTIEFVRREELNAPRNDSYGLPTGGQLWEALFFYGESADTTNAVRQAQRSVVLGYAAEEGSDHIVVADPTPQQPSVRGGTLVHELAHMLQDQQFDLGRQRYQPRTLDGVFAKDGLVEGAAAYITDRYRTNCRSNWQCVENPSDRSEIRRPGSVRFYRFTYFSYSAGKRYVRSLVERNGWAAVTAAHEQPPVSTEQVIHPTRGDTPVSITVSNTTRDGWSRTEQRPETIGEAGIYTLFWRRSPDNSPIDESNLSRSGSSAGYTYASRPSTGWGNDRLVSYANGDERGYVWKTVWDTERDAREFRAAYVAILEAEGATQRGTHTWRIEDGAFADAFSVRRNGTAVTIVNGPTVPALADIHEGAASNRSNATTHTAERTTNTTAHTDGTTTNTPPRTDDGTTTATSRSDGGTGTATTATTGPGFGAYVALVALVLCGIALRTRS